MPEIKHNFTKGKMNKDLDERLVPKGEYRHAMNIQVSTSEGSNVGTIQNILGNQVVPGQGVVDCTDRNGVTTSASLMPTTPVCVGAVVDESNDVLYWFVTGSNKDVILELKTISPTQKLIEPVFIDVNKDTLKFHPEKLITGINVIDGMLFWCDGKIESNTNLESQNGTEPKKINIERCKAGTCSVTTQTRLVNSSQNLDINSGIDIEERHITVLKKSPPTPPIIELESERDPSFKYTGVMRITPSFTTVNPSSFNIDNTQTRHDFSGISTGVQLNVEVETDINGDSDFELDWEEGDTILLKEFEDNDPPKIPITDYRIKGKILTSNSKNSFTDHPSEKTINGDFIKPNSTGLKPKGYDWSGNDITYDVIKNRIEIDTAGNPNWRALKSVDTMSWDDSTPSTYRVKVELSEVTQGYIALYIVSANTHGNGNNYRWSTGHIGTNGETIVDITLDINSSTNFSWTEFADKFLITTKGSGFVGNIESISIENLDASNARVFFEVTDINGVPPKVEAGKTELKYAIDRQDKEEKLYEFKFPRFATRYKYEDGEYSAFSPFSEIAFLPGSFDYHPKKGYNLGMTNRIKKINIKDIDAYIPDDVVSVDILYKEEGSPNIYIVDTVKPNEWASPYEIDSETISRVLPSNQLLRPWDNVPRKALAQDVVGNRIVYGNYLQGYNLIDHTNNDYYSNITFDIGESNVTSTTAKSIKSLREYQLGVVFVDKYGRETPVISNKKPKSISTKLPKKQASKSNQISARFGDSNYMKDMKYFKFFVKETSGEYYNMAMDRFWDAGDGHVWVSFPSSDRNKVDIDTFLILKKGVETNVLVEDPARYKVIAIENEAPDFIKNKKALIEEREHIFATNNIFNDTLNNVPLSGRDNFKMNYSPFANSSGADLDLIDDGVLYVEFTKTGEEATSKRYRINEIDTNFRNQTVDQDAATYSVKLDKILGEDVDFLATSTKIIDTAVVRIYKYKVENSAEFDGRFFVKLINDDIFVKNITQNVSADPNYRVLTSKKLYYLKDNIATTHSSAITGQDDGLYDDSITTNTDFGRYACFFRDYKYSSIANQLSFLTAQAPNPVDVGQYRFGSGGWQEEFLDFTSSGSSPGVSGWDGAWDYTQSSGRDDSNLKQADDAAGGNKENVWFIDAGKYEGHRTSDDHLDWSWIHQSGSTNSGIIRPGSSDYSTLNIAIGGIFHDEVNDDNDKTIHDFFGIGVDGGNEFYQDSNTKDLVSQFNPSRQFRFREDPNANIYTVQPNITYQRLLRYSDGSKDEDTPPNDPLLGRTSVFPWDDPDDQVAQLSPNFTRNWNLKIKNQDETNTHIVKWDPTGTLGPITDGLELTINHHINTYTITNEQIIVKTSSLDATHTDGSSHEIKVGMMLISHSGEANADDTLDGGADVSGGTALREFLVIWKIEEVGTGGDEYNIFLTGYSSLLTYTGTTGTSHDMYGTNRPTASTAMVFKQPRMNGYSEYSANRINRHDQNGAGFTIESPGLMAIGYNIEFIEPIELEGELPDNPAIWETEPKESTDLDIYYEASGLNPIELTDDTKNLAIPVGSTVSHVGSSLIPDGTTISTVTSGGVITISNDVPVDTQSGIDYILATDKLRITKPDGSSVDYTISVLGTPPSGSILTNTFTLETGLYGSDTTYNLNWYNCYSFGNGVESNRIRDNFNLPYILNGVKVSTTLEEGDYKEEHRKYGLIYSGLYNAISGINNLNQFIAAEKITKDINPIYGSIQKLHTRDTDLITLCEDKVLKILASKDAVYNADGKPQLVATQNVLGQTVPFVGEFGISKNPESFASESYRAYFTDKQRGAVMRLSKDGLTPISMHGMKDWFGDNLKLGNKYLLGSYDDKKDEYNITLKGDTNNPEIPFPTTVSFNENVKGWVSFKSFVPQHAVSMANDYYTISAGKIHEHHKETQDRNTFYGSNFKESSIKFLLNDSPEVVKTFNTLNYEGSQSKIIVNTQVNDGGDSPWAGQYYNLSSELGWYVNNIQTDLQNGSIPEFIKKEGKWFNYIKGKDVSVNLTTGAIDSVEEDSAEMSFQGIGILTESGVVSTPGCTDSTAFNYSSTATLDDGSCVPCINGCTDTSADNFDSSATCDDGSCIHSGCMDSTMYNYCSTCNVHDPAVCISIISGCMNSNMFNYDDTANTSSGNCISIVNGCMDSLACNYNSLANTDDGTCVPFQTISPPQGGFTFDIDTTNNLSSYAFQTNSYPKQLEFKQNNIIAPAFDFTLTTELPSGSPTTTGPTSVIANATTTTANLGAIVIPIEDGDHKMSWVIDPINQCINDYSSSITTLVIRGCMEPNMYNTNSSANIDDGSCEEFIDGCMECGYLWEAASFIAGERFCCDGTSGDPITGCAPSTFNAVAGGCNFDPYATRDDGSCTTGCVDPIAENYGSCGSCTYILGCNDSTATNYDSLATQDDGSCTYSGCQDTTIGNNPYWNPVLETFSWCGSVGNYSSCSGYNCCDQFGANLGYAASNVNLESNIVACSTCCDYPGCMDSTAANYDSNATINFGCITAVLGCMDSTACNYSSTATVNDSCTYGGCMDPSANNYDSQVGCMVAGSCTYTLASTPISIDPSSSILYNRIAVSWPLVSGNISGYTVRYKLTWANNWETINVPAIPVTTTSTGDYLYVLDGATNNITNLWPTGQSNPPGYYVQVQQKEEFGGNNIDSITNMWVGGTTVTTGTGNTSLFTGLTRPNFIAGSSAAGGGITIHPETQMNFNVTVDSGTPVVVTTESAGGVSVNVDATRYVLTYTWDTLAIPASNQSFWVYREQYNTLPLTPTASWAWQFPFPANDPYISGGHYFTWTITIEQNSTETINTFLKLGQFLNPIDGTGCHKPNPTQIFNNTGTLFFCPAKQGELATITLTG
jgi:hypothetical protein